MADKKRYIVRKYIMAVSIQEALILDKQTKPEEVWIDPEWLKMQDNRAVKDIGFKSNK